jgi:hypothetical protein
MIVSDFLEKLDHPLLFLLFLLLALTALKAMLTWLFVRLNMPGPAALTKS